MAEMKHPVLGSVINVREDSVKRYAEAGYIEVKPKSSAKKSTSRKSSK